MVRLVSRLSEHICRRCKFSVPSLLRRNSFHEKTLHCMLCAFTSSMVASLLSTRRTQSAQCCYLYAIHGNLLELNKQNAPRNLSRFTQQDLFRRTLPCVVFSWMIHDINEALLTWKPLGFLAVFPLAFLIHLSANQKMSNRFILIISAHALCAMNILHLASSLHGFPTLSLHK